MLMGGKGRASAGEHAVAKPLPAARLNMAREVSTTNASLTILRKAAATRPVPPPASSKRLFGDKESNPSSTMLD